MIRVKHNQRGKGAKLFTQVLLNVLSLSIQTLDNENQAQVAPPPLAMLTAPSVACFVEELNPRSKGQLSFSSISEGS